MKKIYFIGLAATALFVVALASQYLDLFEAGMAIGSSMQ